MSDKNRTLQIIFLFRRWRNWGQERGCDRPKVTWQSLWGFVHVWALSVALPVWLLITTCKQLASILCRTPGSGWGWRMGKVNPTCNLLSRRDEWASMVRWARYKNKPKQRSPQGSASRHFLCTLWNYPRFICMKELRIFGRESGGDSLWEKKGKNPPVVTQHRVAGGGSGVSGKTWGWLGVCHLLPSRPVLSSVHFSHSVMSNPLQPHELQHARPPCSSPTPGVHPNLCPLIWWCHPTISFSVIPFSCSQSIPSSGSVQMSQLFASGGQSIGVAASKSVLPMNTQVRFPLGWAGWISLQSTEPSRVFSNTTVQKHQFFGTQFSL